MSDDRGPLLRPLLHQEFRWFIRLRWAAGAAIVAGDLIQWKAGSPLGPFGPIAAVGAGVLVFNLALAIADRLLLRLGDSTLRILTLAWTQFVVDLAALTTLTMLSGGLGSPLIGFYVFHMIFASLLLSRAQAYAVALVAAAFLGLGLTLSDGLPQTIAQRLFVAGWFFTIFISVHLANRITSGFYRVARERLEQARRINAMQERLAEHERAMHQQEKLVAIGQLAAGIAHEIGNPLASMDGLLQLMERSPEKPRPDAAARLREQVLRIKQTVRQLAELSHPDLGEAEPTDVNELVEETIQILTYDRRLHNVEARYELGQEIGLVMAVPRALQQALVNLVLNALDAMAQTPEPQLRVRTSRNANACVIEIIDNGHGIAHEDRDRVFQPFFTSKPVGKGTGLGLSISRDFITEQAGELAFESVIGAGTTFTIRLPVLDGDADQRTDHNHQHQATREPSPECSPADPGGSR